MTAVVRVCLVSASAKPNDVLAPTIETLTRQGALVSAVVGCLDGPASSVARPGQVDLGLCEPMPLVVRLMRRLVFAGSPAPRRTWHAIRRNEAARVLLDEADVLVALDSAAIRAVWCASRSRAPRSIDATSTRGPAVVLGAGAAAEAVAAAVARRLATG